MLVHILRYYYDTPDVEGNEIIDVYFDIEDARKNMVSSAESIYKEFPDDIWDDDMTWYEDDEIHLGFDKSGNRIATIYCWEIVSKEVQ